MGTNNLILCDNIGALCTFHSKSKRIPIGSINRAANVFYKRSKLGGKAYSIIHHHVKAHQEDHIYPLKKKIILPLQQLR